MAGDVVAVVGIDACPGGWIAVDLRDGAFAGARFAATLPEIASAPGPAAPLVVGVDMPLGLVETGWRAADDAAKRFVGPRRASVFRIPPRPVWAEADYPAANRRCRELTGAGLTQQAWGLRAKLLEANELWARPAIPPLFEIHPEASFTALAGGPLPYAKTTWAGHAHRRSLLAGAGIVLPARLGGRADLVPPIDVLDAAAVAWSATRVATGQAIALPPAPAPAPAPGDQDRRIAIWY